MAGITEEKRKAGNWSDLGALRKRKALLDEHYKNRVLEDDTFFGRDLLPIGEQGICIIINQPERKEDGLNKRSTGKGV